MGAAALAAGLAGGLQWRLRLCGSATQCIGSLWGKVWLRGLGSMEPRPLDLLLRPINTLAVPPRAPMQPAAGTGPRSRRAEPFWIDAIGIRSTQLEHADRDRRLSTALLLPHCWSSLRRR